MRVTGLRRPFVNTVRRLLADERGLTVVELMTTLLVLSIASAVAFGMLHSLMRNARYQEALVNNQEQVRFAMIELTRDIRNANPVAVLDSFADYEESIEVFVGPSAAQQRVRWELSGTSLLRTVYDIDTAAILTERTVLENVDNAALGDTLFRYYDDSGQEITSALTASAADVANCAIRVHVTISAADDPVGSQFTETSDAEIRNRLPGGIGCQYTPITTTTTTA